MNFKDQVILITGASDGIGKRLAIDLASRGAIIVGCGLSAERLAETLKELHGASPSATMIGCDVSEAEQVHSMVARIIADFGKIDVLINNAGVGMRRPFLETDLKIIEEIIRVNYLGAVYCAKAVLPHMLSRGRGHVVNISSGAGLIGTLNLAAYSASKFAMNGWSESLYYELKPLGIHVSIVCPGPVQTEFSGRFRNSPPKSPANLIIPVETVAQAVMKVIETKRFEVILPRWLALLSSFKRHWPGCFRLIAERKYRRHVARQKKILGR